MKKQSWIVLIVGLALIMATAGFLSNRQTNQRLGIPGVKVAAKPMYDELGQLVSTNLVDLPERVLHYDSTNTPLATNVVNWLPRDTVYGQRVYRSSTGLVISASVILMGRDRTSIHKPEYCLRGTGWTILKTELDDVQINSPHAYKLPICKMSITRQERTPEGSRTWNGYYVFWFVADNQLTPSHDTRFIWMARDLIKTGVLQRWAYVAFLVAFPPGYEEWSYGQIKEFIAEIVPQFQITTGPKLAEGAASMNVAENFLSAISQGLNAEEAPILRDP